MEVLLIRAHDLLKLKHGSDPYVMVEFRGITKKTQHIENNVNPVWKETMSFDLDGKALQIDETIEIVVKDYERIGRDRVLGTYWEVGY